jgi:hypothetical protein
MSEPTLKFDASRRWMTVEFHGPPTAEALEAISARLREDEPRCVHAMVSIGWKDPQAPGWNDPRHVSRLAKALNPSLEAFIFDVPSDTVERQSYNTLGDISDVLETCPRLQRAFITGCSTMRKTRHDHVRELHLMGNPLHPSVMTGLAGSTFPALERLVVLQEGLEPANLALCLRSIDAQRLSHVFIHGVPVFRFLPIIGTTPLPWNLCVSDPGLDEVDQLFRVLAEHEALRSGKLQLCSDKLLESEIAQLAELGVEVVDWRGIYLPLAYTIW